MVVTQHETLYGLVEMTMRSIELPASSSSSRFARAGSPLSDSARAISWLSTVYEGSSESSWILLVAAHGVNIPIKIAASAR